ncbi:hypothetical protein Tco_0438702 [Tanacetum coccineum]
MFLPRKVVCFSQGKWYVSSKESDMFLPRKVICFSQGKWYVSPEENGMFLPRKVEVRLNLFAGTEDEDANEHVQRVLEIMDLFHIPGVTHDAIMPRVFPITLTWAARRWKIMFPVGSINTWDLLEESFIQKYCPF